MPNFFFLTSKALLAGVLLSNCSHPAPATTAAVPETEAGSPAAKFPYGGKLDSLNGVPTHRFGEPLNAFTGLVKANGDTPGMVSYYLPAGSAQQVRWFAKHHAEVPGVFYSFRDGKFAFFHAIAYSPTGQAALAAEARFLFGAGRQLNDRTEWVGEQAWAVLAPSFVNGQKTLELSVNSVTLQAEQERKQQAQLKAENVQ
jgi:hypothetical protein